MDCLFKGLKKIGREIIYLRKIILIFNIINGIDKNCKDEPDKNFAVEVLQKVFKCEFRCEIMLVE